LTLLDASTYQKFEMKVFLSFALLCYLASISKAVEGPSRLDDLPSVQFFQPQKMGKVPIKLGEYRKFRVSSFLTP